MYFDHIVIRRHSCSNGIAGTLMVKALHELQIERSKISNSLATECFFSARDKPLV